MTPQGPNVRGAPLIRQLGVPTAVGGAVGLLGTLFWRDTMTSYRETCFTPPGSGFDCLGVAPMVFLVGVPLMFVLSWITLAMARIRHATVVALGGWVAAPYALLLYLRLTNDSLPPVWAGVALPATCFMVVALACLGLPRRVTLS